MVSTTQIKDADPIPLPSVTTMNPVPMVTVPERVALLNARRRVKVAIQRTIRMTSIMDPVIIPFPITLKTYKLK